MDSGHSVLSPSSLQNFRRWQERQDIRAEADVVISSIIGHTGQYYVRFKAVLRVLQIVGQSVGRRPAELGMGEGIVGRSQTSVILSTRANL